MLSASSPVVYPASSSPPVGTKRPQPRAGTKQPPLRSKAGFLIDDESDDDDDVNLAQPAAKRRMLSPSEIPTADSTEPSSPPIQLDIEVATDAQKVGTQASNGANIYGEISYDLLSGTRNESPPASVLADLAASNQKVDYKITTCSGKTLEINKRQNTSGATYERLVAARSKTKEGRATRSFYGIEVHELIEAAKAEIAADKQPAAVPEHIPDHPMASVEQGPKKARTMLWTEKYRARKYLDLCGDDGTTRNVLRWLKRWEPIVFPGATVSRPSARRLGVRTQMEDEKPHRKILMLTGPPGLGKTTLAHVCAKQAGYEVLEINASDDRSRDVVNNQIRTTLGTESVKTVQHDKGHTDQHKIARPVCVVVDEVDGVVSGSSGSGDGGFIRALMDLISTGERNSSGQSAEQQNGRKKRRGDDFRQMRPLVLICNDVYHPSLRPLRQSNLAEVIHVGKPSVDAVVNRLKSVFEKEGIPCEKDAARKLCEAAWGMTNGLEAKRGAESTAEGDLRGVMVVGEWVAGRLRASANKGPLLLSRLWVEQHVVQDLAHGGGGARGVGRGNVKDVVSRVFQEGAGFPKGSLPIANTAAPLGEQPQARLGFSEQGKKYAIERLRQMVESSGDVDRIVTDIFSDYPNHEFNDDSFLSKPDQAYEWLHFHDSCSSRLFGTQEWELAPYLSQPVLACHHLFASPTRHSQLMYPKRGAEEEEAPPLPFSGPRADFSAREAEKINRAMLQALQAQLSPTLMRAFRSAEDIATDFLPYLIRLVSPAVKPVVVGGSGDQRAIVRKESEKLMIQRAADTMLDIGVALQRGKIEGDSRGPAWVYRMEPDIDSLGTFETSAAVVHGTHAPTRYAVRQVIDQEMHKTAILRENSARQARFRAGNPHGLEDYKFEEKENPAKPKETVLPGIPVKKDFFGRIIKTEPQPMQEIDGNGDKSKQAGTSKVGKGETKVWVTFHEGLNNAVRKPLSLDELLRGL
ncbi:hypothetical protein BX600DRAFT_428948 [Xylariales sp. PMI_506]|nr:hypothetical protein BX600DRAFT_428948 [Xylariales sp. PMI_506]